MKKLLTLIMIGGCVLTACKEEKKQEDPNAIALRSQGKKLDLPYQIEQLPDWEIGDDKNIPIAMYVLKGYEAKDFISIKQYLADTVSINFHDLEFRGSRDEAVKFLKNYREDPKRQEIEIVMNDYESVKSKNRGEEYVSLWYTEKRTDRTGAADSIYVMEDFKMQAGKVASMTKYERLGAKD